MSVAVIASYGILTGSEILPDLTGPILAAIIIGTSFGYAYFVRKIPLNHADGTASVSQLSDKHSGDSETQSSVS
jgi:hypothetical protein